jgi:hypothetical protein
MVIKIYKGVQQTNGFSLRITSSQAIFNHLNISRESNDKSKPTPNRQKREEDYLGILEMSAIRGFGINNADQNNGQEALAGCFPTAENCLKTCQENSSATGCEYNTVNKNCYTHTAHLKGVNKSQTENICWLFVGKCSIDDMIYGRKTIGLKKIPFVLHSLNCLVPVQIT